LQVLRRLGYLDADEGVTLKGRVACCFGTGDELISAELALSGALQDLDAAQAAALLSALVFQDRAGDEGGLEGEDALRWGCVAAREAAERVLEAQNAAGMGRGAKGAGFQRSGPLNFGLVGVVKEWARGVPFLELCRLTDVMEGNIVRTITRLDETCREFQNAAHVMGNPALFKLMEAASAAIKRDVVFAASLYVA
ncbi:DSHCT domain-containing protein, partial [Helicosporidium sp. ATCC 50920]